MGAFESLRDQWLDIKASIELFKVTMADVERGERDEVRTIELLKELEAKETDKKKLEKEKSIEEAALDAEAAWDAEAASALNELWEVLENYRVTARSLIAPL